MGNSNNKSINNIDDTINWNTLKTDNISSVQNNKYNVLSNDAINLLNNLKLPIMSESSVVNINEDSFNNKYSNIKSKI